MGMCLLALVVSAALLAAGTTNRAYTIDDINAEMQDPQLRDIFNSAVHKMQDMTADTDVVQVRPATRDEPSFRSFFPLFLFSKRF